MAEPTPVATAEQSLASATRSSGASPATTATPQTDTAANRLAQEIAERMWRRLPITSVEETGCRSMEQVIRAASASHRLLATWREDLARLPELFSTILLRFTGDPPSAALREKLTASFVKEIKQGLPAEPAPLSFVNAEFADLLPPIALQHAKSMLKKDCLALVNTLVDWLDQLQQKQLVGSVTYLDASCRFTHFERSLQITLDGDRQSTRQRPGSYQADEFRSTQLIDHFHETDYSVTSSHRALVHEVHKPELRSAQECQSMIPQRYRRLIEALPDWLAPSVRILEGDLFNHRCVERDLNTERHTLSELVRTEEKTEWLFDPGILLGDYVLAGWGAAEIAAENQAIADEQRLAKNEQAPRRAPWFFAAAGLTVFAASAMVWFAPPLAVLAGVAGVYLTSCGLQAKHSATGDPHRALRETGVFGAGGFALLAALYAALYASPAALVVALGLAGAAYLAHTLPPNRAQ